MKVGSAEEKYKAGARGGRMYCILNSVDMYKNVEDEKAHQTKPGGFHHAAQVAVPVQARCSLSWSISTDSAYGLIGTGSPVGSEVSIAPRAHRFKWCARTLESRLDRTHFSRGSWCRERPLNGGKLGIISTGIAGPLSLSSSGPAVSRYFEYFCVLPVPVIRTWTRTRAVFREESSDQASSRCCNGRNGACLTDTAPQENRPEIWMRQSFNVYELLLSTGNHRH
jgi:hypothetical protein